MIPNFESFGLLVIDVQEKLLAAMPEAIQAQTVRNIDILADLTTSFEGSLYVSEQYPRGLGSTVEPLKTTLGGAVRFEKITFSCLNDPRFSEEILPNLPNDLIICGMETHVCVLQTVLDLIAEFLEDDERLIYVPVDAVCSRRKLHWRNGLDQMYDAGALLTTTETLVFQALGEAGSDRFKHFSKRIR